jgi:hypothetical protein
MRPQDERGESAGEAIGGKKACVITRRARKSKGWLFLHLVISIFHHLQRRGLAAFCEGDLWEFNTF